MGKDLKHQPLKGILDRDVSIASAREIIDKYSPYLKELINYATHFIIRCEKSTEREKGTPLSLISLYYHAIQITDGIEVLTSKGCFAAVLPLLRSLMEATLSIEYILDKDYELRSAAWLVSHYLDRKRFYESLDLSTERGKALQRMLETDRFMSERELYRPKEDYIKQEMKQIDEMLGKPKFAKITEAFKGKNRIWKWFQIDNGPKSFKELADYLHRPLEYEILYRQYSATLHAHDTRQMLEKISGQVVYTQIRSTVYDGDTIYILASSLLINATKALASKFRSEENIIKQIKEIVRRHRPEALS